MRHLNWMTRLVATVAVALYLTEGRAVAEPSGAATPVERQAPALGLDVTGASASTEAERIRRAVESELGVVTGAASSQFFPIGQVLVVVEARSVQVRYESTDHASKLERGMALPVDAHRRAQVIAWVVGNLVRNEASEILAQWSVKPSEEPNAASAVTSDGEAEPVTERSKQPEAPPELAPSAAQVERSEGQVTVLRRAFAVSGNGDDLEPTANRIGHVAFVSPYLALDRDASQTRYYLSFDFLYGRIGALEGAGIGLLVDWIEHRSSGVQLTGVWLESAAHQGLLLSGLGIHGRGDVDGLELAGVGIWRSGQVDGAQIALGSNVAVGGVNGAQISGVANVDIGAMSGAQVAAGMNLAQNVDGLQLAGVTNLSFGDVQGAQVATALNYGSRIDGAQVGLVNLAERVAGLQVGLVNVKHSDEGFAVGLFNWSEGARLQPVVFFQTPGFFSSGYRVTSGHSTGSITFGYDEGRQQAKTRFAVGAQATYGRFGFGIEPAYGWVLEHLDSAPSDRSHEVELTGRISLELIPKVLSVYGGAGGRLPVAGVVAIEGHGTALAGISLL